jgi:hypothetical protein
VVAVTEFDRDWNMADEPCPYVRSVNEPCNKPKRTHYHLNYRPGVPVFVVYYDETPEEAYAKLFPDAP